MKAKITQRIGAMKKQHFIVCQGTYPFDILVSLGHTDAEVHDIIEKKLSYKLSSREKRAIELTARGRTAMLKGGQTVLRLRLQDTKPILQATIAHEVFHCVEFLFDRIGIQYSLGAGEAFAYQIEHITQQIYTHLKL